MPSEDLNIIDEIDNNKKKKHLQADLSDAKFEGEILIGNQEEGNSVFVGTRRLQKNYTNWKSVSTIAHLKKKYGKYLPTEEKRTKWMDVAFSKWAKGLFWKSWFASHPYRMCSKIPSKHEYSRIKSRYVLLMIRRNL